MRKEWVWAVMVGMLLNACSNESPQQKQASKQTYNGPVVEITGADPHYEPYSQTANQDYRHDGKKYNIVQDPQDFTETGLASIYSQALTGDTTATGDIFDASALAAAHPTLPIPCYVRVTNLANGRMIVVRVNDRGPFEHGRIIDLTQAAADRLNLTNSTKIKLDFISVAQDGTLSGPGTIGTTVAKQSYALPARPDIGGGMSTPMPASAPSSNDVRPISNSTLAPASTNSATPVTSPSDNTNNSASSNNGGFLNKSSTSSNTPSSGSSNGGFLNQSSSTNSSYNGDDSSSASSGGGFLNKPTPLPAGVLESDTPAVSKSSRPVTYVTKGPVINTPAPGPVYHTAATPATTSSDTATSSTPIAATDSSDDSAVADSSAAASTAVKGGFMLQVGALSNQQNAQTWQKTLSKRFSVPGKVKANGSTYRVQLGPFTSRQQALQLQKRLSSEANQASFVTPAQ
jgi:rare lipoprotein A